MYRGGKRIGQQMQFDTISQAEKHFADSDGVLHVPLIRVPWNQKIPSDADGIVLEEVRTRYTASNQLAGGERIYA
jgi:hypothetical protein